MKLKNKFFLAQLPVILIITIISVSFYLVTEQNNKTSREILSKHYKIILALQHFKDELEVISALSFSENSYTDEHSALRFLESRELALKNFQILSNNRLSFEERELVNNLEHTLYLYFDHINNIFNNTKPFHDMALILNTLFQDIKTQVDYLVELHQNEMYFRINFIDEISSNLSILIFISTALLFLLSLSLTNFIANKVLFSISKISSFVKDINKGNFSTTLIMKEDDEISDFANELNIINSKIKEFHLTSENQALKFESYLNKLMDILFNTTFILNNETGVISKYNQGLLKFIDKDNLVTEKEFYTFDDLIPEISIKLHDLLKYSKREKILKETTHIRLQIKSIPDINEVIIFLYPILNESINLNSILVRIHGLSDSLDNKINEVLYINHHIKRSLDEAMLAVHCCLEGELGKVSKKQYDYLFSARESIFTAVTEFSTLIDWVVIEEKIQKELVNLDELIQNVCKGLKIHLKNKNIKPNIDDNPLDTNVYSNYELLFIVIKNMGLKVISCAKNNEEIDVKYIESENTVIFTIHAKKIFLNKEKIEDIYHKYKPLPEDTYDNLGLCFYIANKIAMKLSHKLSIESYEKTGTTISLYIPKKGG